MGSETRGRAFAEARRSDGAQGVPTRRTEVLSEGLDLVLVGFDDEFAEEFIGILDGGFGEEEGGLAGVFLNELEAELVVTEELASDLEDAAGLVAGGFNEEGDGFIFKLNDYAVFVFEFRDEGFDFLARFLDDEFLAEFLVAGEVGFAIVDEVLIDDEFGDGGAGEFVFKVTEDAFAGGHEAAGAGFFFGCHFGDAFDAIVFEFNINAVCFEFFFILAQEGAFGVFEDGFEVVGFELFTDDTDGEAADEFSFEAEVDEVLGGDLLEEGAVHGGVRGFGREADLRGLGAFLDDFFEAGEGTADNEEDVAGVDVVFFFFPVLHVHHGHHLATHVAGVAQGDFGLLHEFEEGGLDAAAGDVAPDHAAFGCEFIDFINVDDAVFGEGDVAIGFLDEFADEVIDISADVSGFGEFGGVGFDKGNADEFGDVFDEVGFPNAGGTDDDDVLFLQLEAFAVFVMRFERFHVVVVVTDGDGEGFLGFILANDVAVEVRFDITREVVEFENFFFDGGGFRSGGSFRFAGEGGGGGTGHGEFTPSELSEHGFEGFTNFFGIGHPSGLFGIFWLLGIVRHDGATIVQVDNETRVKFC